MPHLVEPLIEKPSYRFPTRFLYRPAKIPGNDRFVGIRSHIMPNRFPPFFFIQLFAEHIQNQRPSNVGIIIGCKSIRAFIVSRHDRVSISCVPVAKIGTLIEIVYPQKPLVAPVPFFVVKIIEIVRKTFVEPDIAPFVRRQITPEPLARKSFRLETDPKDRKNRRGSDSRRPYSP